MACAPAGLTPPETAWAVPPSAVPDVPSTVSVIIPTWNEVGYLESAIWSARRNGAGEVIVVDGGSSDGTAALAAQWADCVLHTRRGRAAQMNLGAFQARGEILCFLHADCILSPGALRQAVHYLLRPNIAAACFRICHLSADWRFRLLDAGACARVRLWGWAYGDQGLVVRKQLFVQVGGFPDLPIFEDVALCRQLRRFGRIVLLPARVGASPRRWHRRNFWVVAATNWLLAAAYALGISPHQLAPFRPPSPTSRSFER